MCLLRQSQTKQKPTKHIYTCCHVDIHPKVIDKRIKNLSKRKSTQKNNYSSFALNRVSPGALCTHSVHEPCTGLYNNNNINILSLLMQGFGCLPVSSTGKQ